MLRRNTPQAAARLPASAAAVIAVPGMSVDTSAVGADWECPVCAHPIVPRTVFPCGHALCLACSHQVEDCPMCRVEIIFRAADHVAVLGLLTYRRCAPPGGCGFVGSRDAALAHRCPYIVQIVQLAARAQQPLPPPCGVLLQAAAEGSVATIDAFVAQHGPGGLSVTAPTSSGTPYVWFADWTLAHIAAYHGRVDVLECLVRLTGGTDVLRRVAVVSGTSVAIAAVIGGSIPAVEFIRSLLGEGAFGVRNPAIAAAKAGRVPMLLHLAVTLGPGVLVGAFGPETIAPVENHWLWLKAELLKAIAAAHAAGNAAPDAVVGALRGAFGWTREEEEEAAAALQAP